MQIIVFVYYLLDNGLRIIICRLGVVDLVEKSIFPTGTVPG